MADDRVIFVLHRAVTVSRDFDRAVVTPTHASYEHKDSAAPPFSIREATAFEVWSAEQKRLAEVDARIARLLQQGDR